MIRVAMMLTQTAGGWPRTSGDDPMSLAVCTGPVSLAPHERG